MMSEFWQSPVSITHGDFDLAKKFFAERKVVREGKYLSVGVIMSCN